MQNSEIKIILGSRSKIKINALNNALSEYFSDLQFKVFTYNVPSGVPEQPFDDEGVKGASNRSSNAAKTYYENNGNSANAISIGIENFIQTKQSHNSGDVSYDDLAAICIYILPLEENIKPYLFFSASTPFDNVYVEECRQTGLTVGRIKKQKGIIENENDPHLKILGISREIILKETLKVALSTVIPLLKC
jgi:non-canonical (house-cleaning) NTP pyrophosphatase